MRRLTCATLAIATVGALSFTTLTGPAGAIPAPAPSTQDRSSDIALKAYGYGTRATGGQVPGGSDMTAFTAIGCAVEPGIDRHNEMADAEVPGLGTASDVKTELWTTERGAALHSYSRNSTASVVLSDSPLGTLQVRAITSLSHAWHDADGFHAETSSSIGTLEFVPPAGDPQELDLPTPGEPVTIPGFATITVGGSAEETSAEHATARASALRIQMLASGSEVFLARTTAQALTGVKHGLFGGYSAGTEVRAADGHLTSGRNPLSLMPCQGTDGEVVGRDDANGDLDGQATFNNVSSRQWAKRLPGQSKAWERGAVTGLDLGGGQLLVDAVIGKATVTRSSNGTLTRSTDGTLVGTITADGEPQTFPDTGVLEIPGVAKLEAEVVTKLPSGLKVVGLRITLLDGTGAVIDLGVAKATIREN